MKQIEDSISLKMPINKKLAKFPYCEKIPVNITVSFDPDKGFLFTPVKIVTLS